MLSINSCEVPKNKTEVNSPRLASPASTRDDDTLTKVGHQAYSSMMKNTLRNTEIVTSLKQKEKD
jgi:hypothetical protein